MRTVVTLLTAGLILAPTMTACSTHPKETYVDHAWIRLGAVKGRPASAYFTVHGGPTAQTLIAVTTDVTVKSEMHETMAQGTMSSMKPLGSVAIPAKGTVAFQPGGRHVMLYNMNPGITPGATVTLTLTFGNGLRILQDAGVIAAGDPAPK